MGISGFTGWVLSLDCKDQAFFREKTMTRSCCSETGQITVGQAIDLANLIDYASGSVISRTLVKNDAGTITIFAFDEGQGLSEHSAPFDAIVYILDGQAELIIGGKTVKTTTGQLVIMPADVPHAVRAPARFKMLLPMLKAK